MARKPRIHFSGAFYHVMLRGNAGADIFLEYSDYQILLSLLEESVTRFDCRIHAFCLMTNHVHLAIQVNKIPLSKIIQNISFRYTRIINKKFKRIGHVFQGRYKALLIDADNYLLSLVRYIHLNPVRAKMVTTPFAYPWSSHLAYLRLRSYPWLTTCYVLKYFSSDVSNAIQRYMKFINSEVEKELCLETANQKTFPVICDDAFMKELAIIQKIDVQPITDISLEKVIKYTCDFYHIKKDELYKPSLSKLNAKIRAVIAWLAIEFNIANMTTVALHFNREHSTISRKVNTILISNDMHELNQIKEYINHANTQA